MTFDFFNELRRITDAYLAQTQVGIPESIKKHDDIDDYEPDWYGDGMEDIDRYADDPRHGQAEAINKERDRP